MGMKSITIELQDWANWIAQDRDGEVWQYEKRPIALKGYFNAAGNDDKMLEIRVESRENENWRDSKINLNTHSAYIDAEGILRRRSEPISYVEFHVCAKHP